jgi:hypothetical protein
MFRSSAPYLLAGRSVLVALALYLMPAAAQAQDVLTEVSPKRMTKILTSMGMEVEEPKGSGEDAQRVLRFDLGGYRVVLFLAKDNSDAQLFVGFRGKDLSTDKANDWNREHRFGRAYRDKEGDAVLESDIDFTGGVTEANIKAWVKLFRNLAGEYSKFVQ